MVETRGQGCEIVRQRGTKVARWQGTGIARWQGTRIVRRRDSEVACVTSYVTWHRKMKRGGVTMACGFATANGGPQTRYGGFYGVWDGLWLPSWHQGGRRPGGGH